MRRLVIPALVRLQSRLRPAIDSWSQQRTDASSVVYMTKKGKIVRRPLTVPGFRVQVA
jgi:hypothetical protein